MGWILPTGAEISGFGAAMMGGQIHGSAGIEIADKPSYKLDLEFTGLKPAPVGQLLAMKWTGGNLDGATHLEFSGYSDEELASSAKGTLHFAWNHGAVAGTAGIPPRLTRFDHWIADAAIENGRLTLGDNKVQNGTRKAGVKATVTFSIPARASFEAPPKAAASGGLRY